MAMRQRCSALPLSLSRRFPGQAADHQLWLRANYKVRTCSRLLATVNSEQSWETGREKYSLVPSSRSPRASFSDILSATTSIQPPAHTRKQEQACSIRLL